MRSMEIPPYRPEEKALPPKEAREMKEKPPVHPKSFLDRLLRRLGDLGISFSKEARESPEKLAEEVAHRLNKVAAAEKQRPFFKALFKHPGMQRGVLPLVGGLSMLLMAETAKAAPHRPLEKPATTRGAADEQEEERSRIVLDLNRRAEKGRLPVAYQLGKTFAVRGEQHYIVTTPSTKETSIPSDINFEGFFEHFSVEQFEEVLQRERLLFESFEDGGTTAFLAQLRENGKEMPEEEKLFTLSRFGYFLGKNYDYAGEEVGAIPIEQLVSNMITQAKTGRKSPVGQCRQIALTLGRMGAELGFSSFVTTITTREGPHAVTGLQLKNKEIVFFDYDTVLPTGSAHLRDAARVLEMYFGSTKIQNVFFDTKGKARAPYTTRAGEDLRSAAHIRRGSELLQHSFIAGEERGTPIDVYVSNEKSEVTVQNDGFFVSAVRFDRSRDPLNALLSLNALRFGFSPLTKDELRAEDAAAEVSMTYAAAKHKSFAPFGGKKYQEEEQSLLMNLSVAGAIHRQSFGKDVTGDTKLAIQMAAQYSLTASKLAELQSGIGLGERFSYISPDSPRTFYLEGGAFFQSAKKDVQAGGETIIPFPYVTIGAKIPVRKAEFSFETVLEEEYKRQKLTVKPEIVAGQWRGHVAFQRERGAVQFLSGKESLRAELERQGIRIGGLEGAVTIYGAQQRDTGPRATEFGAQFTILF